MEFVGMPAVQILLVAVIVLSLLVEIKTGGMGLGALLGIVAAGIFFGGMYVKGLVSFYHIALFLAGILCIVIEMLTPGAGLFAGIGIAHQRDQSTSWEYLNRLFGHTRLSENHAAHRPQSPSRALTQMQAASSGCRANVE